ncbi:hypothetical protein B0H13DRAFT_1916953 [Mycena leptocephala]|nr:hypothetical protein B0H13DRAFT_1916953 [Mycena leptocephala]
MRMFRRAGTYIYWSSVRIACGGAAYAVKDVGALDLPRIRRFGHGETESARWRESGSAPRFPLFPSSTFIANSRQWSDDLDKPRAKRRTRRPIHACVIGAAVSRILEQRAVSTRSAARRWRETVSFSSAFDDAVEDKVEIISGDEPITRCRLLGSRRCAEAAGCARRVAMYSSRWWWPRASPWFLPGPSSLSFPVLPFADGSSFIPFLSSLLSVTILLALTFISTGYSRPLKRTLSSSRGTPARHSARTAWRYWDWCHVVVRGSGAGRVGMGQHGIVREEVMLGGTRTRTRKVQSPRALLVLVSASGAEIYESRGGASWRGLRLRTSHGGLLPLLESYYHGAVGCGCGGGGGECAVFLCAGQVPVWGAGATACVRREYPGALMARDTFAGGEAGVDVGARDGGGCQRAVWTSAHVMEQGWYISARAPPSMLVTTTVAQRKCTRYAVDSAAALRCYVDAFGCVRWGGEHGERADASMETWASRFVRWVYAYRKCSCLGGADGYVALHAGKSNPRRFRPPSLRGVCEVRIRDREHSDIAGAGRAEVEIVITTRAACAPLLFHPFSFAL